jgi:hypothetical protein
MSLPLWLVGEPCAQKIDIIANLSQGRRECLSIHTMHDPFLT